MEGIGKYKIEGKCKFYEDSLHLVNFKVSWATRRLKVCMHKTMIIIGGMISTIEMKITLKDMVTMMKV